MVDANLDVRISQRNRSGHTYQQASHRLQGEFGQCVFLETMGYAFGFNRLQYPDQWARNTD